MRTDGKILTSNQIDEFAELGFVSPLDGLHPDQAAAARAQLEAHETTLGHPLGAGQRSKSHYMFTWVNDIMRDDHILDAVEDLIGPDILCWGTIFWIKEAQSQSYVGWHQDLQYWGLETDRLVSVWVALSPASQEAGCMSVLPGSHRERLGHVETYHADNLLSRGQELTIDVGERSPVAMALAPGQFSLHDGRLAHGSGPNSTDDRRIGLSMQYMPTSAKQTLVEWDTAALVRGVDNYNHFAHGPSPTADLQPDDVAFQARAVAALSELIYLGAEQETESTI